MPGPIDLDLRHLQALDAVATHGTFARAAARLGYTQSAISQQIGALERLLGGAVFDRPGGPKPVALTPLGGHVLEHARELLARADHAWYEIERFRSGVTGRVRVGTFQSVSNSILPPVVAAMRAAVPDVEITLVESHFEEELVHRLLADEVDLSFVTITDHPDLELHPLVIDPVVLVAPHGAFEPGPVDIALLADRPLIGQNDTSWQRQNEDGLRAGGCDPLYVFRTDDNGAVAALVRSGMGLAVMPRLCMDPEDPRVALHPLVPEIPARVIALAWRRGRTRSPAADHVLEHTVAACRHLADSPFVESAPA